MIYYYIYYIKNYFLNLIKFKNKIIYNNLKYK